jgi:hypothetical protein
LNVITHDGIIRVVSELKDLVNLQSTPNSSCDEKKPDGSLKADVNGDSLNYTFHWFIGNLVTSTPDFVGYRYDKIPPGNYTLQVFDENDLIFVNSITTEIPDESNPQRDNISIVSTFPQTSCSTILEKQTGSIEISVNDAQPENTYQITWWINNYEEGIELSDFQKLFKAQKLSAGNYEVAVENLGTGCKTYFKETVPEEKLDFEITVSSMGDNYCIDGANGSASVSIGNQVKLNPRFYWFHEGDEIDTTNARSIGKNYKNISSGTYNTWVIDLNSDCFKD